MRTSGGIFEKNKIKDTVKNFDQQVAKENFWKDKQSAQKILKTKKFYENILEDFNSTVSDIENLEQLLQLASKDDYETPSI